MVKYTNEERLQIIQIYYQSSQSVTATFRALSTIFGRKSRPSRQAIHSLVNKLESTYSLLDIPVPVRKRTGRSPESIAAVKASLEKEPNLTIPRRAKELGISQSTLWRILREDLGLKPQKIKLPETSESKPVEDEVQSPVYGKLEKAKKASEASLRSKLVLNGFQVKAEEAEVH